MKPHKHAELIKAWADGAIIQHQAPDGLGGLAWADVPSPAWYPHTEYRVKPEPKPDFYRYIFIRMSDDMLLGAYVGQSCSDDFQNLRLTFDGETGQLKSAEVLK